MSLQYAGNWIQLRENEDYDPERVNDQDDGFLYYRYRIEISPTIVVKLTDQTKLARVLEEHLKEKGYMATIAADFEEMLNDTTAQ